MDRLSYAVEALQPGEEHAWRLLARTDRSFDVMAERACRLGFLSASLHLRLDPEASLGLRLLEADALSALARTPAETTMQGSTKAALFRSRSHRVTDDTHLAAMLRAACASDADRLASLREDVRFAMEDGR